MTTAATDVPKLPSLEDDPSGIFSEFAKAVRQHAAGQMTNRPGFERYGLIALVVSADAYYRFAGTLDLTDPLDPVRIPVFVPQLPPNLAVNATHATCSNHREATALHSEYLTKEAQIKQAILSSVGPSILRNLTNPDAGDTVTMTAQEIMAELELLYGTFTAMDIHNYQRQLSDPIAGQDVATFLAYCSNFRSITAKLEHAGHSLSNFTQFEFFTQGTISQENIRRALAQYIVLHPLLADRTIATLVPFVRLQLSNATTTTSGYAGAIVPSISLADVEALIAAALAKQATKANAPKKSGQFGPYCYFHGYKAHLGINCTHMLQDPATFGAAKLSAKNPQAVAGGHK